MKIKKLLEFAKDIDPYGEEDWPEDFDITIERPGLLLRHKKGMDVMSWKIELIDKTGNEYWDHIKRINPDQKGLERKDKKDFFIGLFIGKIMTEEYYEKIILGH